MRQTVTLLLVSLLPLVGSALTVGRSYSNGTSDNDNSTLEDASRSTSGIGSSSGVVDTVGATSSALGYRFTGQVAGGNGGDIVQTINVSVIWTVTAEIWEEYSIGFTPEFHAYMNIEDGGLFQEDGDGIWFSTLQATLKVNGSAVGDSLNMSGGSRTTKGSSTLNRTDSQTLSGYTGNNTFELIYTGTVTATSKAGVLGNDTYVYGSWGNAGILSGTFDDYSSSADGMFVDATVTLNAVPEPASALMVLAGGGLIAFKRRFFSKV